jgi:hypothetical protein
LTFGVATGTTAAVIGGVTVGGTVGAGVGAIKAAASGEDIGKGALMGAAGGAVTGGVAPGLGAAVAAPLVSAVGPVATGAVVGGVAGAAGGAASSAVGGQDIGKGALMGVATGAVAGGTMGAIGPAEVGNASPNIEGATVPKTSLDSLVPQPTSSVALPNSPVPSTSANALGDIAPPSTTLNANPSYSADQIKTGLTGLAGVAGTEYAGKSIIDAQDAAAKAAAEDKARGLDFASQGSSGLAGVRAAGLPEGSGPLGGLGSIGRATGGITALAHGGQVALGDGAYIIPADVVSALGNGSSKAGAEYLRRLMIEVRKEAVNIQGMGAAKKHVS